MKKIKTNGFTLLELILYMGIVTIILSAIIPFAWNVIESGAKSGVQEEVYDQGRFISEKIEQEIRNAQDISLSTSNFDLNLAANPGKKLSIIEFGGTTTIFDVQNGKVRITQGANPPVNLNSNDTNVTDLTFTNYSSADSKTKNIDFTLTVQDSNNSSQSYSASISLRGDAEVRSN